MKKGDLVRPVYRHRHLRRKGWRGVIIKVLPKSATCLEQIRVYSIDGFLSTYSNLFEVVEQNFSI